MRHHDTSERETRATSRRHRPDPVDERPEPRQAPPRQATPAHRPAPQSAPQDPPVPSVPPLPSAPPGPAATGPAATGQGGDARHAAPASQVPQRHAPGAGAAEHRPDRVRPARPDVGADDEEIPDLLGAAEEEAFRGRWREVQGRFVDDPRQAVHAADVLVGDVMRTLADTFARHRHALEGQWSQGLEADTESLRRALCQYRALFHRLLST
ncbi:hypothetical protein [Streptomyces sp. TLI_105]|uniref:hypothetical protein n=1 Tax=Streptomyces sp. TLI_105 TaxID=1881019 RepID=UPI00089533B5|nr:hypothetical protein [Streptomyces sp. TLI_105]SEE18377.1 hypothetical protein SAMN05428939_7638 [Streptomyces sp. TLI_105]